MPTGVYKRKPFTKEHKRAIGKAMKGKKHTEKWKRKFSKTFKKLWQNPKFREKMSKCQIGHTVSKKTREKISKAHTGMKFSNEHKQNLTKAHIGYKMPDSQKKKIGKALKGKKRLDITGKNHPGWRGGISNEPYSFGFNRKLKDKIRKRDNYACQLSGKTEDELGEKLSVHHIDYDKKNCGENNLISLSRSWNSKVNSDRLNWIKYFDKMLLSRK